MYVGIAGNKLFLKYIETLGIAKNNAKEYIMCESFLESTPENENLNVMLRITLGREIGDFSKIKKEEIEVKICYV